MNFGPTQHTLVRRFIQRDQAAMSQFFKNYHPPLLAYARRHVRLGRLTEEDAEDCVSALIIEISNPEKPFTYDPAKGRLRNYLCEMLNRRISTFVRDANLKKRGGGIEHVPLDESTDAPDPAADTYSFDRDWAGQVVVLAMNRLEAEQCTPAQKRRFALLKPTLNAVPAPEELAELASALGIDSDSAYRAIKALRVAYRRCLRAEIRDTLYDPSEANVEADFAELRAILWA
jgi:DNA-directed RNA polymerase specialized sigma24 family protein